MATSGLCRWLVRICAVHHRTVGEKDEIMTTGPQFVRDWCRDREFEFAQALRGVSLVIETNVDEDMLLRTAEMFGRYAARLHRVYDRTGAEIVKQFPALTLVALVGHAATDYEQNRFWVSFWEKLDIEREQSLEHDFRRAVPELLHRFKLAEFPQLQRRYVQQLALHAGLPNYCLGDVVEAIKEHLTRGREATGAAVIQWLCDPAKPHRLGTLDVPAQNFVRHGGEFAVDIIDRILEVVLFVADNPTSWSELVGAGELTTETTGLPSVMLDGLLDYLEDHDMTGIDTKARRVGASGTSIPFLSLDPLEDTVQVCLPHLSHLDAGASWTVSLDGEATVVRSKNGWGGSADQAPSVLAISRPTRTVIAHQNSEDRTFSLPLVDPADPMVLFGDNGRLIGRRDPVPIGNVYALLPKGSQLVDGSNSAEIEAEIEFGIPSGWFDWRLITVSTEGRRSLQLVRDGQRVGAARAVRNSYVPELLLEAPVAGVTSTSGTPVYAERPTVWLPPHPGGAKVLWQVGARRVGSTGWVARSTPDVGDDELTVDPFGNVPNGLLGAFEVVVRGPLGSDLRRIVFIAEGLEVSTTPEFRRPEGEGLSASYVDVAVSEPLLSSATRLDFDARTRRAVLTLDSDEHHEQVVICPPSIEIRLDDRGMRPSWTTVPHLSTPGGFSADKLLALRVPAAEAEVWIELRDGLGVVQQVGDTTYRAQADSFEVSTVRFRDTLAKIGVATVVAGIDCPGQATLAVPLVHIRPARLCAGMDLVDGRINFNGLAALAGVTAQIWSHAAPWRFPIAQPVIDQSVSLPDELQHAGPIAVRLVVEDPWSPADVPRWPTTDCTRLGQSGWVKDSNPAITALSRYLAGSGKLPDFCRASPEVWTALAATEDRSDDWHAAVVQSGLSKLLAADPRTSLESLAHSMIPVGWQPELIVRSGLVFEQFRSFGVNGERSSNPWAACMSALADLPYLSGDPNSRVDVLASARREGGPGLYETMQTGIDPALGSGLFDAGTLAMDRMDEVQVEAIFEAAKIVPGALLDSDSRVVAASEAFAVRMQWASSTDCRLLNSFAAAQLRSIKRVNRHFYDQISIRSEALDGVDSDAHPWLLMPTASLTVAFLARIQAHELTRIKVFDNEVHRAWAHLAKLCPKFVLSDLLCAEAMIIHSKHGNLLGECNV